MAEVPICKHGTCEDPVKLNKNGISTGYCEFHRTGAGKSRDAWERWPNKDGYIMLKLPTGHVVVEHRYAMEQKLGRQLTKGETVHHKDGDRTNNSPENLELWWSQPYGQRVEDLLRYVVQTHPERLREMLSSEPRGSASGRALVERDYEG